MCAKTLICLSNSYVNIIFFEIQNIPLKNKKNFHVKMYINHFKFLRIITLCLYVRWKHIKHLKSTLPSFIEFSIAMKMVT